MCKDPFEAMEQAKQLGIHTILTSGQKNNCVAGSELLTKLVESSEEIITILVAGGVNAQVIEQLYPKTKATSYHMSGKITKDSKMVYRKKEVSMGLPTLSEYEIWQTKEQKIKEAVAVLRKLKEQEEQYSGGSI